MAFCAVAKPHKYVLFSDGSISFTSLEEVIISSGRSSREEKLCIPDQTHLIHELTSLNGQRMGLGCVPQGQFSPKTGKCYLGDV